MGGAGVGACVGTAVSVGAGVGAFVRFVGATVGAGVGAHDRVLHGWYFTRLANGGHGAPPGPYGA